MDYVTILGLFAAGCTTGAYLPQAIKTIKTKHTKDLSLGMYWLINIGIIGWLVYGIMIKDLPIVMANGISILFTAPILFLKIKHG